MVHYKEPEHPPLSHPDGVNISLFNRITVSMAPDKPPLRVQVSKPAFALPCCDALSLHLLLHLRFTSTPHEVIQARYPYNTTTDALPAAITPTNAILSYEQTISHLLENSSSSDALLVSAAAPLLAAVEAAVWLPDTLAAHSLQRRLFADRLFLPVGYLLLRSLRKSARRRLLPLSDPTLLLRAFSSRLHESASGYLSGSAVPGPADAALAAALLVAVALPVAVTDNVVLKALIRDSTLRDYLIRIAEVHAAELAVPDILRFREEELAAEESVPAAEGAMVPWFRDPQLMVAAAAFGALAVVSAAISRAL